MSFMSEDARLKLLEEIKIFLRRKCAKVVNIFDVSAQ